MKQARTAVRTGAGAADVRASSAARQRLRRRCRVRTPPGRAARRGRRRLLPCRAQPGGARLHGGERDHADDVVLLTHGILRSVRRIPYHARDGAAEAGQERLIQRLQLPDDEGRLLSSGQQVCTVRREAQRADGMSVPVQRGHRYAVGLAMRGARVAPMSSGKRSDVEAGPNHDPARHVARRDMLVSRVERHALRCTPTRALRPGRRPSASRRGGVRSGTEAAAVGEGALK